MSLPRSIENWLYSVLQPQYVNKQVAYTHIHHFLLAHLKKGHDFRIRTAVHTSVSGHPELLVNLYGTIRIDDNLGVPVTIWIPWDYPFGDSGVPIVYIAADHSRNWFLRPTNNVDSVGKFYHPYLTEWSSVCINEDMNIFLKFNLVLLLHLVASVVSTKIPIYQGSLALPPKPPSSAQKEVPNSVSAPATSIPARYALPLPLPAQNTEFTHRERPQPHTPESYHATLPTSQHDHPGSSFTMPLYGGPQASQAIPTYDAIQTVGQRSTSIDMHGNQMTHTPEYVRSPPPAPSHEPRKSNIMQSEMRPALDLMDSAPETSAAISAQHSRLLNDLATRINALLPDMPTNVVATDVNVHMSRSDALYSQLSHHHRQAQANSESLSRTSLDLRNKIEAATALNKTVETVVAQNAKTPHAISTEPGQSVDLDELIVADSPLVTQLYDVVLEIKACRDTIKLLEGSFKGHSELISDKNLRQCVKQARSICRDLFWLEITKKEILQRIRQ